MQTDPNWANFFYNPDTGKVSLFVFVYLDILFIRNTCIQMLLTNYMEHRLLNKSILLVKVYSGILHWISIFHYAFVSMYEIIHKDTTWIFMVRKALIAHYKFFFLHYQLFYYYSWFCWTLEPVVVFLPSLWMTTSVSSSRRLTGTEKGWNTGPWNVASSPDTKLRYPHRQF